MNTESKRRAARRVVRDMVKPSAGILPITVALRQALSCREKSLGLVR
jgi:hypothetical protein